MVVLGGNAFVIYVIWEFRAKQDKSAEFQREYSATGVWAQLFRKSPDYKETILLRDPEITTRYVVVDVWKSRTAYEQFKRQFSQEYAAVDRKCEELTESETRLGIFEAL